MARRKYPFYRPVGHRTADKVRNSVASTFHGWITTAWGLFILWVGIFILLKVVEYNDPNPQNVISFGEYLQGTWNIIEPILTAIINTLEYIFKGE